MSLLFSILALLLVVGLIVGVVFIVKASSSDSSSDSKAAKKALFGTCKTSFDCQTGFFCEVRDHPSHGLCVIPPGGACHSVNKNEACYSGYYCDKQDGVCLKTE